MFKVIYTGYGIELARYAGPKGKAMFQLTFLHGQEYVQLDALDLEDLLGKLVASLHNENLSYGEVVKV